MKTMKKKLIKILVTDKLPLYAIEDSTDQKRYQHEQGWWIMDDNYIQIFIHPKITKSKKIVEYVVHEVVESLCETQLNIPHKDAHNTARQFDRLCRKIVKRNQKTIRSNLGFITSKKPSSGFSQKWVDEVI